MVSEGQSPAMAPSSGVGPAPGGGGLEDTAEDATVARAAGGPT